MDCYGMLELQDPDLNWVNISTGLATLDGVLEAPGFAVYSGDSLQYQWDTFDVRIGLTTLIRSDGNSSFAAAHVVTAGGFGAILFQQTTSGTPQSKVSASPQNFASAALAIAALPAPDAGYVAAGYVVIHAGGADWTAQTDDLIDGSDLVTAVFVDAAIVGDPEIDWFNSATWSDDIDWNTMSFSAELLRDEGSMSLAPLMEGSELNRDAAGDYAPFLDLVRQWRASTCVVVHGDPVPTWPDDYHEIARGYIDESNVNDSNDASISVAGRGEEATLIDTIILEERTYSVGTTDDLETVIQAILDDNVDAPPALYVPTASSYIINEYIQAAGDGVMAAITALATVAGWACRYRYDPADGINKLTLFLPLREAEETDFDWEIGPEEYLKLPVNKFDIQGVRNYIVVTYNDETTGLDATVISPVSGTSGSITRYKKRAMIISLGKDSQIRTAARAQQLADAVRMDLEYPRLEEQFQTYGFWFVQLCDYAKMLQNNVTY